MDTWSIAGIFSGVGFTASGLFCIVKSALEKSAAEAVFADALPQEFLFSINTLKQVGIFLFLIGFILSIMILIIEYFCHDKSL